MELLPLGDSALLIRYPARVEEEMNLKVQQAARRIQEAGIAGVESVFPALRSMAVRYRPDQISYPELAARLRELLQDDSSASAGQTGREVVIPVRYGGEWGPDLKAVAEEIGCTPQEVVELHSQARYRVYMIGFTAGFPYMGQLPEPLRLPRKAVPSLTVAAGSVAIVDRWCGIYPAATPGGWHVIGRTELEVFDPHRQPPALLLAGDQVRFEPVEVVV